MQNNELVQKGAVVSTFLAKQQCMEYLAMATADPTELQENLKDKVNRTTGLLIVLMGTLDQETGGALVSDAAGVLRRLVGISVTSSSAL